jgi:hypothetical protein
MITIGIIIRKLDKEDEEERKKYGLWL